MAIKTTITNSIRKPNARLVSADIDTLGVTFAAQSPYRADGFLKVNVTVANANPTQKMFLEGADFTIYAIGGNVTKLSAYSLSMFKELEQVWLFSSTMVEIEETDNNAYLDYLKPSCVIYVPSNLISNYQNAYSNLSSKFVPINQDYTLTIVGSGTLTSEIITDQLMNGIYNAQDRRSCTKLVINGFDNYMDALWGYNLSDVLPSLNNNVWYNATEIDFTTRELEGVDELLESDITNLINGISTDKINGVTQLKFSGFSDMSVALTYDYSALTNLEYIWLDNARYEIIYLDDDVIAYEYITNKIGDNWEDNAYSLNTSSLYTVSTKHRVKFKIEYVGTPNITNWLWYFQNSAVQGGLQSYGSPHELAGIGIFYQGASLETIYNSPKDGDFLFESGNVVAKLGNTTKTVARAFSYTGSYTLFDSKYSSRYWYFKIYDNNDNLVLDLVPCYNKTTQKFGMYDKISGTTLYTSNGDLTGSNYWLNPTYFYPLSNLETEYDARLTQTFYLDYNGTLPSYADYQLTYYTDINCTTSILPTELVSGTRYYVKAVMVTLTIQGSGALTSAIVEPQVAKAGSGVTKVVIPNTFSLTNDNATHSLDAVDTYLPNVNTLEINSAIYSQGKNGQGDLYSNWTSTNCKFKNVYLNANYVGGNQLFSGCKIEYFESDVITYIPYRSAFANTKLKDIKVPNVTEISSSAFSNSTDFGKYNDILFENVTTLSGERVFDNIGLGKLFMPKLTNIANQGLGYTGSNCKLFITTNNCVLNGFLGTTIGQNPKLIYFKATDVAGYMVATNWSDHTTLLVGVIDGGSTYTNIKNRGVSMNYPTLTGIDTEANIQLLTPADNSLYLASDTGNLWQYVSANSQWVNLFSGYTTSIYSDEDCSILISPSNVTTSMTIYIKLS